MFVVWYIVVVSVGKLVEVDECLFVCVLYNVFFLGFFYVVVDKGVERGWLSCKNRGMYEKFFWVFFVGVDEYFERFWV